MRTEAVADLERKMHSALDDALVTIKSEVRADIMPLAGEVDKLKREVASLGASS